MKNRKFERLKILYLFIFILTAIIVIPTHIFPQPYFMPFRFPHYLEAMRPFLGVSWPTSFEIYHYVLYTLVVIGSLNALGTVLYPKLNKAVIVSSLTGAIIIPLMILFFFFQFVKVNVSTAIIFGIYSVMLLTIDILTFKTFTGTGKEA